MTLGDLAAGQRSLDLIRRVEQAQAFRDADPRPADPLGNGCLRQAEILDQLPVGLSLFEWATDLARTKFSTSASSSSACGAHP